MSKKKFSPGYKNGPEQIKELYAKISPHGIDDIMGKLLTYSDMSFSDKEQRRAFKSMIKSTVWEWFHRYELFTDKDN